MANNDNIKNTRKAQRATKPVVTIDWTSDKAMTPYYDHENKRYAITVTLRYETAGQNFRRAYPDEYIAEGVNKILLFYNKTLVDGVSIDSIASAMDFFVPERPRAKVRVSVGIPQDKFDNTNLLTDSQFSLKLTGIHTQRKDQIYSLWELILPIDLSTLNLIKVRILII